MYHNQLNQMTRLLLLALLSFSTAVVWAAPAIDQPPNRSFTFNFEPTQSWDGPGSKGDIFAACGVGGLPVGVGAKWDGSKPGQTMCSNQIDGGPSTYKDRFVHDGYIPNEVLYLQEVDKDDGIWHQVLIDENENFKMDIYIYMSMGSAGLGQGKSMSGGKNANHVYPLDSKRQDITGTGTGDARRVQFRMLIDGPDFSMDMLKDKWDRKPKITQNVSGQDMNMDLVIDTSNSSYSDMSTTGIVTHTTEITDLPSFSFDSRTSDTADVTAGRYKITHYSDDSSRIDPHYVYIDAPTDFGKNLDWVSFWHGSTQPDYWQPGESYGYGGVDGSSGDGEDTKW